MTEDKHESIDKMTVKELREVAKEFNIAGTSSMKKDELLTAVKKAQGTGDTNPKTASPPEKVKKKVTSVKQAPITSVKECKALINVLRQEKVTAKANGDKKIVEILRRRINSLKKKSRKFKKVV